MHDRDEKVISKIRKLLALAANGAATEAEAALAAQRAAEMMDEHKLSMATIDAREDAVGEHVFDTAAHKLGRRSWVNHLVSRVAEVYGCQAIRRTAQQWGKWDLIVIGRPSDVEVVEYVAVYLSRAILRLADEAWRSLPRRIREADSPRSFRHAFGLAAAIRISDRLADDRARRAHGNEQVAALIVAEGAAVQRFIDTQIGKIHAGRADAEPRSRAGVVLGQVAADGIELRHAVTSSGRAVRMLS